MPNVETSPSAPLFREEAVIQIPLTELHPFPDHPFKVRDDEAMRGMLESVREMDNDSATILMVDSNIQRENILPSEKAEA